MKTASETVSIQKRRNWPAPIVLLGIILLAVVLRVPFLLVASHEPQQRQVSTDGWNYLELALNMIEGRGFGRNVPLETEESRIWAWELCRTPGYPLLIAAVTRATGGPEARPVPVRPNFPATPWTHAILTRGIVGTGIFQAVLNIAICVVAFVVCRRLWGANAGLAAGLLLALDVQGATLSCIIMTEPVFAAALLITVLVIYKSLAQRSWTWAMAGGLLLGGATLVRPTTQYLPMLFTLGWLGYALYKRSGRQVAMALCFGVVAQGLIAGWSWRNQRVCGERTLSTVGWYNLIAYHAACPIERQDHVSKSEAIAQILRPVGTTEFRLRFLAPEPGERQALVKAVINTMREYPKAFVVEYVRWTLHTALAPEVWAEAPFGLFHKRTNLLELFRAPMERRIKLWLIMAPQLIHLAVIYYLLFRLARQRLRGQRFHPLVVLCLIFSAYVLLLSSGAPGGARFRATVLPLLVVAGAASLVSRTQEARPEPAEGVSSIPAS